MAFQQAPASRNSFNTSAWVSIVLSCLAAYGADCAPAPQPGHDVVQMLQDHGPRWSGRVEEVACALAGLHLQGVDIAAEIADHLRDLGERPHFIEN